MIGATIFDVATTSIPLWSKPVSDPSQPRVMQIAAVQFDPQRRCVNRIAAVLKREVWTSSAGSAHIHQIPESRCDRYGLPQNAVLSVFMGMVRQSDVVASFGLSFDRFMAEVEFYRLGGIPEGWIGPARPRLRSICIREAAAQAVSGGKTIKLGEAHSALVGVPYDQTHDAEDDAAAAARVFWALVDQGKMEI